MNQILYFESAVTEFDVEDCCEYDMSRVRAAIVLLMCGAFLLSAETSSRAQQRLGYRVETRTSGETLLRQRFTSDQLALLEQLNRADLTGLERLPALVILSRGTAMISPTVRCLRPIPMGIDFLNS
jgi:hypothetical protein